MIGRLFAVLAMLCLGLAGCSSSSSSGPAAPEIPTASVMTVSGVVVDPEIQNAYLEIVNSSWQQVLICGALANQPCRTWTNDSGEFAFSVDDSVDLSDYYIITTGGEDSVYKTSLDGVSFAVRFSMLVQNSDKSYSGVVISPMTSLATYMMDAGVAYGAAVSAILDAFSLPADSDISISPLDDADLLKASYLAVKISLLDYETGSRDAMKNLAVAIINNPGKKAESDEVLAAVFGTDASAEPYIAEAKETAVMLGGVNGSIADSLGAVSKGAKAILFKSALSGLLENYPTGTVSDDYAASVILLSNKIGSIVTDMAADRFIISQIANYVILKNSFFGDYSNFTNDAAFSAELDQIMPADRMAEFTAALNTINTVRAISVELPVKTPLGDDNTKRAEYYFNSTADKHYKARQLAGKVTSDELNDTIYNEIAGSYAGYGMHEKAADLAVTHTMDSLSKAKAISVISNRVSKYSKTDALIYAQKAETLLDTLIQKNSPSGIVLAGDVSGTIDAYGTLINRYMKAGGIAKGAQLRTWFTNTLLDELDETTSPKKSTKIGSMISAMSNASEAGSIHDYIEAGDYVSAMAEIDSAVALTDLYVTVATANYNSPIMYYCFAIRNYRLAATASGDAAIIAEAKAKISAVFDKAKVQRDRAIAANNTMWMGSNYFGLIAGHIYWALGKDAAMNDVYDKIDASKGTAAANGKARAAYEMLVNMIETEGLTAAVTFYKNISPLGNYDDIGDDRGWVTAFTFNTNKTMGLVPYAISVNNLPLAEEGLDYIDGVLDDAAANFAVRNPVEYNLNIITVYEPSSGNKYALSNRYLGRGYLKVAEGYYMINKPEKAKATLAKAEMYVATVPDSFLKAQSYGAIGYYYKDFGFNTEAHAAFDKAAAVVIPDSAGNATKTVHYTGLANDTYLRGGDKSTVKYYLSSAMSTVNGIHTPGADNNTVLGWEIIAYNTIASQYANISEVGLAESTLDAAITSLRCSTTEPSVLTTHSISIIERYATIDLIEQAYEKSQQWLTTLTDKNKALVAIAKKVIEQDAFADKKVDPDDIAFADTDKDGKPDFFVPWATAEQIAASGLIMDDDIDGDGKDETVDLTPFYAD